MSSKTLNVLLVDVSKTVHRQLHDVSSGLHSFVHSRVIFKPKDEVGLVLFGSNATHNDLNTETESQQPGEGEDQQQYSGVYVVSSLRSLDLGMLRMTQEEGLGALKGDKEGDFLDALTVGIDMLLKCPRKATGKRLLLLTDLNSEVELDEEFIDSLVAQMQAHKIQLEVVCIPSSSSTSSPASDNKAALTSVVDRVGGIVRSLGEAQEDWDHRQSKQTGPLTGLFRGELQLGESMSVKVWVYKKTGEEKFPSLKKYSPSLPPDDPDATHLVKRETVYRSTTNPDEDDVPPERRVSAFKFGKQRVPVSAEMGAFLKFQVEKGMQLVGFTPRTNIPRHYFMKDTAVVIPWPGQSGPTDKAGLAPPKAAKAARCVSALARALDASSQCAIVRCAFRAGASSVTWGVLLPHLVKGVGDFLLFNHVPFAEDLRDYTFDSFFNAKDKVQPSQSQLDAAESLISSFDLSASSGHEDPFPLSMQCNPALARFRALLKSRALDPDAAVPPSEDFLTTQPLLERQTQPTLALFRDVFPIESKSAFVSGTKRGREDDGGNGEEGKLRRVGEEAEEQEATQPAEAVVGGISIHSLAAARVSNVSLQTPVEDFRVMLQRRDGPGGERGWVEKAIEQMNTLILTGSGVSQDDGENGPAILNADTLSECIRSLRTSCVVHLNPGAYNDLLIQLQANRVKPKIQTIWEMIKKSQLSLISNAEVSTSGVTSEESTSFFKDRDVVASNASTAPVVVNNEDDFDDME
mmetsp:Transcript_31323/g.43442  ORF Transcript_31323/g.43442 Transcript_31323/m.43442 type:complete len:748 (+) Transcript_31323:84-2327(+)|eukprot:CAMPEP_0196574160 /NCGR_PEP_ID=MMETSP1081-20130531/3935_1 /TAXON_ID=36882 /ORGANISM="Pyramimonas amylifera, Strain CCMP720" /LENGTH=747 /DNA_ID=CAMNT_0041892105 /DNA_START=77 /DNA_END=2320 /DNA_ORIENTATION=+